MARDLPLQDSRTLRISVPAKPDKFLLVGLSGEESVNNLFRYTLDLISNDGDIVPDDLLGSAVTFGVVRGQVMEGNDPRPFNGIVSRFGGGAIAGEDLYSYRMEVVPKLWLTGLKKRSRVFVDVTVGDVIDQVLQAYGIRADKKGTFDSVSHKIITQYQESDLGFFSRLVEMAGGCWYFTHTDGAHNLVVGVGTAAFGTLPDPGFDPNEALQGVSTQKGFVPKKVTVVDWNFKTKAPVTATATARHAPPEAANLDTSEFLVGQGNEETRVPLDKIAARKLEAMEWEANLLRASTDAPMFSPGLRFASSDYAPKLNGTVPGGFVVAAVRHAGSDTTHVAGGGHASYRNEVMVAPDDMPLTAPPRTQKPRVMGLHTAVITDGQNLGSPSVDPDAHSRVKIKFHWGLDSGGDILSFWCRVAQMWTGPGWGSRWTPHVGTEVLVAFIDGDPDRPIVVGCLYNGTDTPPFGEDGGKHKNGWLTISGHEFYFDDKQGNEKVRLFSKKDAEHEVKNNQLIKIGKDLTEQVVGNVTQTVEGKRTTTITKDTSLTIEQGKLNTLVQKGNIGVEASLGNINTKAAVGSIIDEATTKIAMTVGANSITIDQSGITIKGIKVTIEGTAMVEVKAPLIKQEAQAMMIIKGGIVMIN
jgi:type VI secretion system secreted protein VgrG